MFGVFLCLCQLGKYRGETLPVSFLQSGKTWSKIYEGVWFVLTSNLRVGMFSVGETAPPHNHKSISCFLINLDLIKMPM